MDRSHFKFSEEIVSNFELLLIGNGYTRVSMGKEHVRYASGEIYIEFFQNKYFEIGLEFGLLEHENENSFGMSELIRLKDIKEADRYRNYSGKSTDSVKGGIKKLVALFKKYGKGLINSDKKLFKELKTQRKKGAVEFEEEVKASQIRPQAENAFRNKEYRKAFELYISMEPCLSPAERKKLNFAKQKTLI